MIHSIKEIKALQAMRQKKLKENLEHIVQQLKDMGAQKIILFGSYANGRIWSGSDLDLICVMPSMRSGKAWMKIIYDEIDRDVDCDILAYTKEELSRIFPVSRFVRYAFETGRIVYEKRPEE